MLVYAYKNTFLDIFPWPNFFQAYCKLVRLNTVLLFHVMKTIYFQMLLKSYLEIIN